MRDPHEDNHYWEYREEENRRRAERNTRYIDPRDPDYVAPEAWCKTCETYTTAIDRNGCCTTCWNEVVA